MRKLSILGSSSSLIFKALPLNSCQEVAPALPSPFMVGKRLLGSLWGEGSCFFCVLFVWGYMCCLWGEHSELYYVFFFEMGIFGACKFYISRCATWPYNVENPHSRTCKILNSPQPKGLSHPFPKAGSFPLLQDSNFPQEIREPVVLSPDMCLETVSKDSVSAPLGHAYNWKWTFDSKNP